MMRPFKYSRPTDHTMVIIWLFFIIILSFTIVLINRNGLEWEAAAVYISVVIASLSLTISVMSINESARLRAAQTDPLLIPHITQREDAPIVLMLTIANVGGGAAINISINADTSVDEGKFRTLSSVLMEPGLSGKTTINAILPARQLSYTLNTGPELVGEDGLPNFPIVLTYHDTTGKRFVTDHVISVDELFARPAHNPPYSRIAAALEKIEKRI